MVEQTAIELEFPATPSTVSIARGVIGEFAIASGAWPDLVDEIRLAVTEAVSNVVRHAYPGRDGVVVMAARLDDDAVLVTVRDFGVGPASQAPSDGMGLGRSLMGMLARMEITAAAPGTLVTLRFDLAQPDPTRRALPDD